MSRDQRYYQGKREIQKFSQKLPMAMIHESCIQSLTQPGTPKVVVGRLL